MVATVSTSVGTEAFRILPNNTHAQWRRDPGLRRLMLATFLVFMSATANGYDTSLINGLLAIPAFNSSIIDPVNTDTEGLIIAAVSLGGFFTLPFAGYFSDRWGRKAAVGVGSALIAILGLVQALIDGPWAFLGIRISIGVGIAFVFVAAPPLAGEISHPRLRGQITNSFQASFYWGSVLSAIATLGGLYITGSWSWRMPVLLQIFFPFMQLLGLWIIPESPRYLVARGRESQALRMLARFHANGDENDPLVHYELSEIREAIARERHFASNSGWKDFVTTRQNRHRLLICVLVGIFTQWAGNGIVSYYLSPILRSVGITDSVDQASINLGLQVWNAIMALVGAFAAERYGRRPLWLTSALGMLFSFAIITPLAAVYAEDGNDAAGQAVIAFLFVFFGFYDVGFTPLSVAYPVEILPYRLRSKGLTVTLMALFATGFSNQFINPIAFAAIRWRYYFVYIGTLSGMIALIYFLFPETKGRSLEEIATVFEGTAAESQAYRRASEIVRYDSVLHPDSEGGRSGSSWRFSIMHGLRRKHRSRESNEPP
ncbi:hypothetical protein M8818_001205 [Zalaria obscura]|uniref:Uncharacterized protein n=1 Tax=Zalaria obscura TaxID=2024903 RepID=A0ACC3SKZ9_9PEZI